MAKAFDTVLSTSRSMGCINKCMILGSLTEHEGSYIDAIRIFAVVPELRDMFLICIAFSVDFIRKVICHS